MSDALSRGIESTWNHWSRPLRGRRCGRRRDRALAAGAGAGRRGTSPGVAWQWFLVRGFDRAAACPQRARKRLGHHRRVGAPRTVGEFRRRSALSRPGQRQPLAVLGQQISRAVDVRRAIPLAVGAASVGRSRFRSEPPGGSSRRGRVRARRPRRGRRCGTCRWAGRVPTVKRIGAALNGSVDRDTRIGPSGVRRRRLRPR